MPTVMLRLRRPIAMDLAFGLVRRFVFHWSWAATGVAVVMFPVFNVGTQLCLVQNPEAMERIRARRELREAHHRGADKSAKAS